MYVTGNRYWTAGIDHTWVDTNSNVNTCLGVSITILFMILYHNFFIQYNILFSPLIGYAEWSANLMNTATTDYTYALCAFCTIITASESLFVVTISTLHQEYVHCRDPPHGTPRVATGNLAAWLRRQDRILPRYIYTIHGRGQLRASN